MSDASVSFTEGYVYGDAHSGVIRKTCCQSCAFREGEGTVRPDDVTPDDVWLDTEVCDDFVCHTQDADGSFPSCAGWHARKSK